MRRTLLIALPAVLVWLFVTGCYTKLYRPGFNGPPETMTSETLYERYDSSAIDTTLERTDVFGETYPGGYDNYDRYDRWDTWGRYRPRTRWGFDFYNYSPPYYSGYYGWEDYYGYPWWYSYDHGYWGGRGGGGTVAPGEPPSKRPFGRRDGGDSGGSPPSVSPPPSSPPPPSRVAPPSTPSTPTRPAKATPKKSSKGKQRDFGRRK